MPRTGSRSGARRRGRRSRSARRPRPPSADVEPFAGEAADVVVQADEEEHGDQSEANDAGSLHNPQRDRLAAKLLDQAPEDVAPVEGQNWQQVDQPQREA